VNDYCSSYWGSCWNRIVAQTQNRQQLKKVRLLYSHAIFCECLD